MNIAAQVQYAADARSRLGVYQPSSPEVNVAHWRINGYRATIRVWTADEWQRLPVRPADAQFYPCGIWCALRFE